MPAIQVGKRVVTGPAATLTLLAILALIVGGVMYARPSLSNWPMWVSGGGWVAFVAYWNVAAKKASAARTSESADSRQTHELMLNGALLLLFAPIPGLRYVYLPESPLWVPLGLGVQAGFFGLAAWSRKHLGTN